MIDDSVVIAGYRIQVIDPEEFSSARTFYITVDIFEAVLNVVYRQVAVEDYRIELSTYGLN